VLFDSFRRELVLYHRDDPVVEGCARLAIADQGIDQYRLADAAQRESSRRRYDEFEWSSSSARGGAAALANVLAAGVGDDCSLSTDALELRNTARRRKTARANNAAICSRRRSGVSSSAQRGGNLVGMGQLRRT